MSQRVIYALRPQARARVNTVYLTTVFTGGAISPAVAGALHHAFGRPGVARFAAARPPLGALVRATGRTTRPLPPIAMRESRSA